MANEEVLRKVTERDAAQELLIATRLIVAGLGFDVEIKLSEVSTREGHKATIIEGYRDLGKALAMISAGCGISPTEIVGPARLQPKPAGIILPGQ